MTDVVIFFACALSASVVAYLSTDYFYLLGDVHHEIKKSNRVFHLIFFLVNGTINIISLNYFSYAVSILAIVTAVTLESMFLFRKEHIERFFNLSIFMAAALNLSGAYMLAFLMFSVIPDITWTEDSMQYHALVMFSANCISSLVVSYFLRSKRFPNDDLADIFKKPGFRRMLIAYFALFSAMIIISLNYFMPKIMVEELPWHYEVQLVTDLIIKTIVIIIGSYLMVFFLCKFNRISSVSEALSADLKKEKEFRKNVFSDSIDSFCANLTRNTIEEWDSLGDRLTDDLEYTEIFGEIIARFVHADDHEKLMKYLNLDMENGIFRDFYTSIEKVRIDRLIIDNLESKNLVENLGTIESDRESTDMNREWIWVEGRFVKSSDENTGEDFLYVTLQNINARMKEELTLKKDATRDALTGIYNRRRFISKVKEYMSDEDKEGTLFLVDLDNFKSVNDNFGHPGGDRLLIDIANLLLDEFRSDDVVARIGGDEFAVFSKGIRNIKAVRIRGNMLCKKARRKHLTLKGEEFYSTISIGAAIVPIHGTDAKTIYSNADAALYEAKNGGKDRCVIYSEEM